MKVDKNLIQRQLELELEGVNQGITKIRSEVTKSKQTNSYADMNAGSWLIYQLMSPYVSALVEYVPSNNSSKNDTVTKDLILKAGIDKVAYIALRMIVSNLNNTTPFSLSSFCVSISKAIVDNINIEIFREHMKDRDGSDIYVDRVIKQKQQQNSSKQRVAKAMMSMMEYKGAEVYNIPTEDAVSIGYKLLMLFIQATGLVKISTVTINNKSCSRVEATPELITHIDKIEGECELLHPFIYPMLVPPKDHSKGVCGGFLSDTPSLKTPIIKDITGGNRKYIANVDMPLVYRVLNNLQKIPWRINTRVLEVLKDYVERDKKIEELDIPSGADLDLPIKPWGILDNTEWQMYKATNPDIVREYCSRARDVYNENIIERSKRLLYKTMVSIATKFKDEAAIYFVYNLDWRGRIYPIQSGGCPNPQGLDASKALLEFVNGVPMGERGGYWLSVQGANTFGFDKIPMDERGAWAMEHEADILAVARDPFENKWWWEADDSWKFLAFCFEWAAFHDSGYSKDFLGHLPIALDGSCSGIQHFSALLLDERGAIATNVVDNGLGVPSDIYGEVAKVVSARVEIDALSGIPEAQVFKGRVNRSLCKRNTMTTPYGVSKRGMVDQLLGELDRRKFVSEASPNFVKNCKYLAGCNYDAIGEVVVASRVAMGWLKDVSRVMAKADKAFYWTVPSGFVVEQKYLKPKTVRVNTFWGGTRVRLNLEKDTSRLDYRKITSGQAPNYIHSMDAAHLMLTVHACISQGITDFALIHDSFGTHAGNTDSLARVLREQFVKMYTQDNLELFREEVIKQMPVELRAEVPPVPAKGTLNICNVLQSTYFFS